MRRDSVLASNGVPMRWAMSNRGEMMRSSRWNSESHVSLAGRKGAAGRRVGQSSKKPVVTMMRRVMLPVLAFAAALAAVPTPARSQSSLSSGDPLAGDTSSASGITSPIATTGILDLSYIRPSEMTKASNYGFDTFGPYPIAAAGVTAGINQFTNSPPEWGQGAEGFGKRFGSDFGTAAISTTTRYGLSEAFREDTLYYRCECRGLFPRLRHAVVSTFTGRHGDDGHRAFSFSALAAPYAGSMVAVYAWYPDRFGAKDAFRMGNYSLLTDVGGNIALEFFYSGPHALISRLHLNNTHGSPIQGPNR
jgi:hypothetical protein